VSIQVTACLNPFSGERKEFSFEQGITINEIIRNLDALNAVNTGWRVMIDDEIITDFERVPEEGQRVYLKLVPEGDNQSVGAGMKVGGVVLSIIGIIVAAATSWTGVGAFVGAALLGAGIGLLSGGVVLYNTQIPSLAENEKPEQDPAIRGSRNQMRPYGKIPVLLGKRRIYADACANPYTWVDSNGAIWLNQLFCVAQKDIQIDTATLKIDETLLKDYSATGDISRVLDQSNPDPLIQMKISYGDSTPPLYDKCVHEIQLNTVLKHQTEDGQDGSVIRTTPAKTTKINVDVFFYNGLGKYNDKGGVESSRVELKAEYKKSTDPDSAYQLLGYFSEGSNTISGSELKTKRYAITKDNLVADSYTVKISRVSEDSTDTKIIDTVYVGSIRAANNDSPVRSARCQQVTLIGLKIKASEKLNNIVEQLNFVAQSKMPVYNSQSHQWTNALTSNPASAAMYAMQGEVAQQQLSNSDIDLDSFAALYDWCEDHDYECNAYITDNMTINSLLSSIASTCRAEILRMNGKITVIQDIAKNSFVQLFTPRNSHDYKETMALADIPDVLKMGIVDKTNGYAENEVPVYNTPSGNPVSGVEPHTSQNVSLWGVTDSVQARKLGMYNYAVCKHRFTIVRFSCDFEYLMCRKGDWIKYAGDIALAGLKQGRIKAVDGQKLILDEQVTMENGKSYAIRIRKSDGTAVLCNVQTVVGTSNEITISEQIPFGVEGCLFAFGVTGNETIDLIVTDIQCGENLSADLTCVEYAPEIFGVDDPDFVLPDFVNKLSSFDSVVDPGDVNGWRTFATYNDSDSQPAPPTGGGTSGAWHLQQTENSKWISTKTAASIYEGEWSAPMPTGKKVMNVLVPDGEIGDPDSVTGLIAAARQNEIKLEWNPPTSDGIKEGIKTYYVECSKNNGEEWLQLIKTNTNSASYTFNRATDGYPKASVFSTWKFRVRAENIYGKLSSWTETTVNTLGYFSWVPSTPTITKAEADRDGIDIAWSTDEAGRYGTPSFSVFVRYNGADHAVNVNANNTARFNFNRNDSRRQDAYPEATDLANWTVKVVHKNESDSVGVTTSKSVFTDNYGTWIPATLSFASKIPSEGGISLTWNQATGSGNKQLYGTQRYTAVVKYADAEHSVSETVMGTLITNTLSTTYYFKRSGANADGYPEKNATANYKGLDKYTFILKVDNESGNTPVSSAEIAFSSSELNNYKSWTPNALTGAYYPSVNVSKRQVSIAFPSQENVYGNIKYKIRVKKVDESTWYTPNLESNCYEREDVYKKDTEIALETTATFRQMLPLTGQNMQSIQVDRYDVETKGGVESSEHIALAREYYIFNTEGKTQFNALYHASTPAYSPELVADNITKTQIKSSAWLSGGTELDHTTRYVIAVLVDTPMPVATEYQYEIQAESVESGKTSPAITVNVTVDANSVADLVDSAITQTKLADGCVTTDKIAAGAITAEQISATNILAKGATAGSMTTNGLIIPDSGFWASEPMKYTYGNNQSYTAQAGEFFVGNNPDHEAHATDDDEYIHYKLGTFFLKIKNIIMESLKTVIVGVLKVKADNKETTAPFMTVNPMTTADSDETPARTVRVDGDVTANQFNGNLNGQVSGATRSHQIYETDDNGNPSWKNREDVVVGGATNADQLDYKDSLCFMHNRTGDTGTTEQLQLEIVNNGSAGPCCGSYNITDGPFGNYWYNYIYIPHRDGIGQDSYLYGTLIVFIMNEDTNKMAIKHLINGTWQIWREIQALSANVADYATNAGGADMVDGYHASGNSQNMLFRCKRAVDVGVANDNGYWAGMCNINVDGWAKWWHILSMDWEGSTKDPINWCSQILLPTQQDGIPKYRFNANGGDTAISSSPWKDFITEENIGSQSVERANKIRIGRPSSPEAGDIWIE